MHSYGKYNMPNGTIDLDRLKQSVEFMSKAGAAYDREVRQKKERDRLLSEEPQPIILPPSTTNGTTEPSG